MRNSIAQIATGIARERSAEYDAAWFAAQPDARTAREIALPEPTTFDVLHHWNFRVYDYGCWNDAVTGEVILRSMEVTDPSEPTSRFIVTYDARSSQWRCQCPSLRGHWAQTIMWAVQMRIEDNRRARLAIN